MPDPHYIFWDNVHRVHCCPVHGCKWNDPHCPVVTQRVDRYGLCPKCIEESSPADTPSNVERHPRPVPSLGTALFKMALDSNPTAPKHHKLHNPGLVVMGIGIGLMIADAVKFLQDGALL